ncbi:MAG: aconitate hydratase AcnA [Paracoccaceae bacterium]
MNERVLTPAALLRSLDIPGQSPGAMISLSEYLAARDAPLPYALRVVAENLARQVIAGVAEADLLDALLDWTPASGEIAVPLKVSRLMLPDSSGLPVLMDLAAARDRVAEMGGDPALIEPQLPVTLVVDHSLVVDRAGHPNARQFNIEAEYHRNRERYSFFKWAEQAFDQLRVVPPGAGIIHQVHLERLARLIDRHDVPGIGPVIAPEFVLGCDSHTTMVNGIGLLAWGVGGIDGEAVALGQDYVVRIPRVVGVRLEGRLPAGATATDLVLTLTEHLRQFGVVGDFVEFFGPGLPTLSVPDRATIANMAPEYGATVGYFPIDEQTIHYLRASGREEAHVAMVDAYARAADMFADGQSPDPAYSAVMAFDLGAVSPSVAGPKRPQDRVALTGLKQSFLGDLTKPVNDRGFGLSPDELDKNVTVQGLDAPLRHGSITIAAITSCTNTSNPSVMIGAGLLARNARARGLDVPNWVKTSMAPGSRLVEDYLRDAGLLAPLEELGFGIVGFGCTTCSGKSGPVGDGIAEAVLDNDLVAAAVLSGNRNFEGRIHKTARAAYLASPPLIVALALAGRVDIDFEVEPLGHDPDGAPVFLRDIWPDSAEQDRLVAESQNPARFAQSYATLFDGSALWDALEAATGPRFAWDPESTYICRPPFFENISAGAPDVVTGARVLVRAGDSLTTDHVTPSGEILPTSLAGQYLMDAGVRPEAFNAVTQRRGNHEFMARVTFANQRMRNLLVPGQEGGFTRLAPDGDVITIHAAAMALRDAGAPAMVLAGRDYGMGSSRDWAAKGPVLLGVRVILAQGFERIHRANLIGMGILPLIFAPGEGADSLGLSGFETFDFQGLHAALASGAPVGVTATGPDGATQFPAWLDISSDHERNLLRKGGIFAAILNDILPRTPSTSEAP